MSLNIWALAIVKAIGLGFPAFQIVFLRALVGLVIMLPWIVKQRSAFSNLPDLQLHTMRVVFSAIALTASFYAIARLPLALFTAISFTRPILTMIAAAILLREVITRGRWLAAFAGLLGVIIAVEPSELSGGSGLFAQVITVLAATAVVIITRRLVEAPTVVMMTFYTAGLTVIAAPFAYSSWQTVAANEWPALLAVGAFAQAAQFCFLRAHRYGQAAFLAILSYASLLFSTTIGYFVFNEVPSLSFWVGASLIISATLWITLRSAPTSLPASR
ncbi:MAG: DMT family transporter [Boseongicola sp.]|nr:DMT family transporter [Boseongicola sp.]